MTEMQSLMTRVESLERRTRALNVFLFAGIVILLVLGAVSATVAQQRSLDFRGGTGHVKLSADGLYFYDKKGVARLAIYLSNQQEPVIRLKDASDRARSYFSLTADAETPRVEFDDTSGQQRLYVGLATEQTGLVRTFTKSGGIQTSLEDDFLRIRDSSGVEQLYLGVSTENKPMLKMWDASHTERLFAGVYTDGSSGFTAYNASGNSTWSSP